MDPDNFNEVFLISVVIAATISVAYVWFITARRHWEFSSIVAKIAPILVATIAGLTSIMVVVVLEPEKRGISGLDTPEAAVVENLDKKLATLTSMTNDLTKQIDALANVSAAAASIEELSKYENRIVKLEASVKGFEGILITDAEKLVTLPLLKKDLETIRSEIGSVKELSENQANFFQESLNQSRWILGTLGLGILALIFPIARAALVGKPSENSEEKS